MFVNDFYKTDPYRSIIMNTKELILKEIENLEEDDLKNIYERIKEVSKSKKTKRDSTCLNN